MTAAPALPSRLRWRALLGPAAVHYEALVVSLVLILWIGRDQWFFGDDWAILAPHLDGDPMLPHVGHWNLIPALLFPHVRDLFGLGSYVPFLALALVAHLAVAHLIWRLLLRTGAVPWIATGLSVLVMVLGGGAENILWAFQFGFMGAIALGLLVVLMLDRERLNVPVVILAALVAPMFSGTALPVLAAAAVVGVVRHGVLKTLLLLLPAAVAYISWFVFVPRESALPPSGIHGMADFGFALAYAAAIYGGGLGRILPIFWLGVVPALGVAVWVVRTIRRGLATAATPAYALVFGSLVFAALTTYSRMSYGITGAAAQRYAYVTVVLLLPAGGLALSWLWRTALPWRVAVGALTVALVAFNLGTLVVDAGLQAVRENDSRIRIAEALDAVRDDPTNEALLSAPADPIWAPDLLGADLVALDRANELEGW